MPFSTQIFLLHFLQMSVVLSVSRTIFLTRNNIKQRISKWVKCESVNSHKVGQGTKPNQNTKQMLNTCIPQQLF